MARQTRNAAAWTLLVGCALFCLTVLAANLCHGQEVDESKGAFEPQYAPGLVAGYRDAAGGTARRVDPQIAFTWRQSHPDQRLSAGPFHVRWAGLLHTQMPGEYILRAHVSGRVTITVAGERVIDGTQEETGWIATAPLHLDFGYHPLEVEFEAIGDSPRLGLFWTGPRFSLEPITARWLMHDPAQAPPADFEAGRELVRALRCGACHELSTGAEPLPAAALERLSGNISAAWLHRWLTKSAVTKPEGSNRAMRRMPHFALSDRDAAAITAYLLQASADPGDDDGRDANEISSPGGNRRRGERLLVTIGCLACHTDGELGSSGLFGGGDLSDVAAKRPANFFARWLSNPSQINSDHRMPVFRLSDKERNDLAAYLVTRMPARQADRPTAPAASATDKLLADGRRLVAEHRCGACHRLPSDAPPPTTAQLKPLNANSDFYASCLGDPHEQSGRPGYALAGTQRSAIERYLREAASGAPKRPTLRDGRAILAEHNCLACHARGSAGGLAEQLPDVAQAYPELSPRLPTLSPPPLDSVGDKMHEAALAAAITGEQDPLRPWLAVRMPKFDLSSEEVKAVSQFFIDVDRIPAHLAIAPREATSDVLSVGPRLVTSEGFGCTSCHQIGSSKPVDVQPGADGPDLSMLSERIRRPWFDRWVRDPARIVPRMEMPAVQIAVEGVLENDLSLQLAGVWRVLNEPGFEPPAPGAIRTLRRRNLSHADEPAALLLDNVELGEKTFVKPVVVALPNRHNVLFDLETQRLTGWWLGDAAKQHTRAKYWYWQAAGTPLASFDRDGSELALMGGDTLFTPQLNSALPPELDAWELIPGGVRWSRRLSFRSNAAGEVAKITAVTAVETYTALPSSHVAESSGFRRHVRITGVPSPMAVVLFPLPAGAEVDSTGRIASSIPPGRWQLQMISDDVRFNTELVGRVTIPRKPDGTAEVTLQYTTRWPVDRFVNEPPELPPRPAKMLELAPGFETTRLPLRSEIMPTGLAWRRDGKLVVASLKGRIWLADDSDGDELEDRLTLVADGFSAPYGVNTTRLPDGPEAIDVVDKSALTRLYDDDGDEAADRAETLVAGWGHSEDYHGWIAGLPRDDAGNYFVAVSQRGGPTDHLRGRILRLAPRAPMPDIPRRYSIETLSVGSRFPLGIARNARGELFVSDNQGNYTPFNEINHVEQGDHFGFLAPQDSREQNVLPKKGPAVAIPHPWTRSVNGISFLDTPPAVREKLGRDLFGPFEGHLVGCDYDPRRLVRISLQQVDGRYQGAVYPMSLPPSEDEDAMLGPIVCHVAPDGDLYIGGIRDSAWGAGRNTGELLRLRIQDLPPGIAEVRSESGGLVVEFTQPLEAARWRDRDAYSLESFRRIPTPAYGGDDVDRRRESIQSIDTAPDGRQVKLTLESMQPGRVYELRVTGLSGEGEQFFPDQAYFTYGPIPQ
ncbi:MAG: c-type cytochrome [Pirellulales bacterium]